MRDELRLACKLAIIVPPLAGRFLLQFLASIYHRWTYQPVPNPKTVVVIGGGYAGIELVRRLIHSLPTGYRVVLVEKNSHLHHLFNFPRFSVVEGHEHTAFIPYDGVVRDAPGGMLTRVQAAAARLTETTVVLESGEEIEWEYVAVATGCRLPPPASVASTDRDPACREMQAVQRSIREARKIAVVGAGAVGVELASDIKACYPDKDVTLVHSRDRVLSQFGSRLHDAVMPMLEELGIRVLLGERPQMRSPPGLARSASLNFSGGRQEEFDLIIPCTGQQPNSSLVATLLPDAVSAGTSRILVRPTLQVDTGCRDPAGELKAGSSRIFALGDVAEHGGPRMARAGFVQADIVCRNILAMVDGKEPNRPYLPSLELEGALKLTVGLKRVVLYTMDEKGSDILITNNSGTVGLGIAKAWRRFGADVATAQPVAPNGS